MFLTSSRGTQGASCDALGNSNLHSISDGELGIALESDRYAGEIFGLHQGCQVPFRISRGNVRFLLIRCSGKRPHLTMRGEPRGFSRVAVRFSSYDGQLREPLMFPQGSPISIRVARGS